MAPVRQYTPGGRGPIDHEAKAFLLGMVYGAAGIVALYMAVWDPIK